MAEERAFLGRGWGFFPNFNKITGSVDTIEGVEDIHSSLKILLSTRPGERVMRPDYGCNLDILLFEPITTTLITFIKDLIKTAIIYHEPRIETEKIDLDTTNVNQGLILIKIVYKVRQTNSRFNFVYPFYLNEGPEQ